MTYYLLVLRENDNSPWQLEFGAYDRSDVKAELDSYTEHNYLKKNAKIITSGDTQAEINAAITALNS